jgi:hypothetical protein
MTQTKNESIIKTYHSITVDGTDIETTKFYEYIKDSWTKSNNDCLNFEDMAWDNGHDVLRFITNCHHINLIDFIKPLSKLFPKVFFMYDFYTDANDTDIDENVYWLYEGIANTNKIELEESYKK